MFTNFRAACTLDYNDVSCYESRKTLDGFFVGSKSSLYNVYAKCYNTTKGNVSYVGEANQKC